MDACRIANTARIPTRAYETSAGYDLYSTEDIILPYKYPVRVNTQIAISLPENTFALIIGRSSFAAQNIYTHPGLIDPDFRGAIEVILTNFNNTYKTIKAFTKIAQFVICPLFTPVVREQVFLSSTTRGVHGFGSSDYASQYTNCPMDMSTLPENISPPSFSLQTQKNSPLR